MGLPLGDELEFSVYQPQSASRRPAPDRSWRRAHRLRKRRALS